MLRIVACLLGLLMVTLPVFGEEPERHLSADAAGLLCKQSAFLHGYIHGYENGFRIGDLDIHLGRKARVLGDVKEYRHMAGYRSEFGERGFFRLGYQQGFRAGYDDVRRGVSFRGIAQLRQAAVHSGVSTGRCNDFDRAVSAGYDAGHLQGLSEQRARVNFEYAARHCLASRRSADYCDAYARGFRLGYADGILTPSSRRMETATASFGR